MYSSASAGRGLTWYHGWNIIAVCVLSLVAATGLTTNAFSLFLHDWSEQLQTPVSTFQFGFSLYVLITALLAPVAGICADKFPARLLIGTGVLLMAFVCLTISFATAAWQIVVLYALPVAIVSSLAGLVVANALVSRWFIHRIGLALGLTALGQGLPGVILPPIIAAVLPSLGWRMVWLIGSIVIGLVVLPLVIRVLRDRPTESDGLHYSAGGSAEQWRHTRSGDGAAWRDILARRNFWVLLISFLPTLACFTSTISNFAPIIVSHGLSEGTAGTLLSVFNFSQMVATLVSGTMSDRFDNRLPLAGLAFASTVGTLLLSFGNGLPVIALAVTFIGLSGGFWPIVAAAAAKEFGADRAGRAFGLLMAFIPVIVLAPFMIARIQEITGSYAPGLCVLALLSLVGGITCLLMLYERPPMITPSNLSRW